MAIKFDENEGGGKEFPILPPAEYECVFTKVLVEPSKAGNPMIKATLTIRKELDGEEQEGGGRKLFENIVFTKDAMFKFHQLGKALGWEQGREFEDLPEIAAAILYQPIRVKTKNEPYEGKINPKVSYYKPAEVEYAGTPDADEPTHDPFANDGKPIDISDDDLPF